MRKIIPEEAVKLSKKLNKATFDSNPFYLVCNCFIEERNGEEIVLDKDFTDGNIKPLFLPKKIENIRNQQISCVLEEDLELLKKLKFQIKKKELYGYEYMYRTKDLIELEGAQYRAFRKAINQFERLYKYKVLTEYPTPKVIDALKSWSEKRSLQDKSEESKKNRKLELELDMQWLGLLDKIPNKRIFIEIDNKLVGFAVFLKLNNELWIGLMQKTDYEIKGVSRFLYNLKAKEMKDIEFFSTGTPGDDKELTDFKESMRPVKKVPIYVLEVGDKD